MAGPGQWCWHGVSPICTWGTEHAGLCCRLQPSAVVTDEVCAACDFNRPGKTCLRPLEWTWRGETYAATMSGASRTFSTLNPKP